MIASGAVIVNASESNLVGSATDVAVTAGALFGAAGRLRGGVYCAVVGDVATSVPHPGEQSAPPALKLHVTTPLVVSFWSAAVKLIAVAPAAMVVILLVIVTEIAGPMMLNASKSDFVWSFTDVAVMVGALFGVAGRLPGAVYVTLVAVAPLIAPHPGEQAAPPAVKVQVTPAFVASFCTDALNVTAVAPAVIVVILFAIVTDIAGGGDVVVVPPEHPANSTVPTKRAPNSPLRANTPVLTSARTPPSRVNTVRLQIKPNDCKVDQLTCS